MTEVTYRKWVKRGEMLVNTSALDIDDPDHVYNQILAQGVDPADFGVKHPLEEEFEDKSRSQLIDEIIHLRKELEGWCRADAAGLLSKRY